MRYLAIGGLIALAACTDSVVPNFNSPNLSQGEITTPANFQLLVTGLFGASRIDVGYLMGAATSFARDMGNFTNSDNRFITQWLGDATPISTSNFYGSGGWTNQFRVAKQANLMLATIPHVTPAYTPADQATLAGIAQTLKALNFMYLAEWRDTNGVPIGNLTNTNFAAPAPILCIADVWKYIVALLDSGNTNLNKGGRTIPVILPAGFIAAASVPGPSTAAGSFAAFNRALAGKANLELAYAIARQNPGTAPTPTSPGVPDHTALVRADSAITHSSLYNPAALLPPTPGGITDPLGVYHSYSGVSGDVPNPFQLGTLTITTLHVLKNFQAQVDTANDLRWRNKIVVNPVPLQQPTYSNVVATVYTVNTYPSVGSQTPIIRNEELTLLEAQVQLGLGNFAAAWANINAVRTNAGGLPALPIVATYTGTRDALLAEQRISLILEGGGDRMIAIRMYGLQTTALTEWGANDTHASVLPIPNIEANARLGNVTPVCP
jgi:starch-binding outer membrane protein, SusD/RagB family